MRFSDSINFELAKPTNYGNSNSAPFDSDDFFSDDVSTSQLSEPSTSVS